CFLTLILGLVLIGLKIYIGGGVTLAVSLIGSVKNYYALKKFKQNIIKLHKDLKDVYVIEGH
ncbi:MAG: hypothetical protein ACKO47_02540, partial [Alphaproteobacteria bacterium]